MALPFFKRLFVRRVRTEIDPEEIFLDAANAPGFRREQHEGRIERPISYSAFTAFAAIAALGILVIAGRLAQLQLWEGNLFAEQARANKTYPITIQAPRGIFYDRNFEKLVENRPSFVISLTPGELPDDASFREVLGRLSGLAGKSIPEIAAANDIDAADDLLRAGERAAWPTEVFIAADDLRDAVLEIQTRPEEFPGVRVAEAGQRYYPLAEAVAHVVGYVGRPTREELAAFPRVGPADILGKIGLERQYEETLRGTAGEKLIEIDAAGEAQRERFIVKPNPGRDVVLELDAGLQEFAARALSRHLAAVGKQAGAIVAVDPRDGAIRALVSYPAFDPNIFGRSQNRALIAKLLADPTYPFYNRAIAGEYPSGSTIKPIMALAALEEGIIDPEYSIYDPGYLSVPNPYDPSRPSIFKDWRELGWVDMRRAIAMSANVYFYTIGGGHGDIEGLGIARIKQYLERFGWGSTLGIDLAGEAAGLIPDPEKKKAIRPQDPIWRLGDTYITSIGQGDLQATPLQLAVSTAAIANGGTLWRPRLAHAVVDEERRVLREFEAEAIRTDLVSQRSLDIVRDGMREAVTSGSAVALNDLFFTSAGKTGTAQTGAIGKNHGWFIGYAPYESPEIAIAVLVEEGSGGSTDAVPIAKEILYHYFVSQRDGESP
ncbi:penicillin-binding protein 2 [Candidatus Parcubacteria bacterium]|nr:MAG: penicillin-binding protein 2 [Candidatus Parcubacteria bacterium]